jgi:hypothetical protein
VKVEVMIEDGNATRTEREGCVICDNGKPKRGVLLVALLERFRGSFSGFFSQPANQSCSLKIAQLTEYEHTPFN